MNTLLQKSQPLVTPKIWKRDEILTFLDIFESTFHASVTAPFKSEDYMWKCITDKLLEQGITASVQQCLNKWNFLYKTYMSNQNRQGVFYAKVKQIVEYSQQLSEQQEVTQPVADEEQVVEYDTVPETFIKQEKSPQDDALQMEVLDESLNDHEQLEDMASATHEQIEEIVATSNQEHFEEVNASDQPDTQPEIQPDEVQCDSREETSVTETPVNKKRKLSDDTCDQKDPSTSEPAEENLNLFDTLQTILSKINAIQDEQTRQGRRIANIEKRQDEHTAMLHDIKKHIGLK